MHGTSYRHESPKVLTLESSVSAATRTLSSIRWTVRALFLVHSESGVIRVTAVIRRFVDTVQHNAKKVIPAEFL